MKSTHFAALFVGILIGVGATLAFHLNRPGPDAGDWLAFIGALVGVSVTILGTLWLEDYRASRQERENIEIYRSSLNEMSKFLNNAARERGEEDISSFRPSQIKREEKLSTALEKFMYARHYVPNKNIAAWQAAEELWSKIEAEKSMIDTEIGHITEAGNNEAVLQVNLSKMSQAQERLRPYIDGATSTLG